jgi:hypothetical protein
MRDDAVIRRIEGRLEQVMADFRQLIADVRQLTRDDDVVGLILTGNALNLQQAAYVRQCSDETIRTACEKAAGTNNPLGAMVAGRWIIDPSRLLDWIERDFGKPARLVAKSRLENLYAQPQEMV